MSNPFLAFTLAIPLAIAPLSQAQTATAVPASSPRVTLDITGTYPANMPTTTLTAPNASFLFEITVPQTVPATTIDDTIFSTAIVSGTYSFNGRVFRALHGSLAVANHNQNYRWIGMTTTAGTIGFQHYGAIPPFGFPNYFTVYHPSDGVTQGTASFSTGDFGAGPGPVDVVYPVNNGRQTVMLPHAVTFSDMAGRLVAPKPAALAAEQ